MHQSSALSPLLFVIVMEVISREFRSALAWELLYADDLVVIAVIEDDLIKRLWHTHTQPFYNSLDFVWDNPGEPVPEGTFHHLLDFMEQNEDNMGRRTNNPDGLPPHPD